MAPWLRDRWVEEEPQTTVVWRTHLPVVTPAGPTETDIVRPDVLRAADQAASRAEAQGRCEAREAPDGGQ